MAAITGRSPYLRVLRVLLVWLFSVSVSVWKSNIRFSGPPTANNATSSMSAMEDDEDHFTLCGRTLYTKDMPHVPSDADVQYGIARWRRSLDHAVVLGNECCHGRTGNQIRAFFHAFDWARDKGSALVIHEDGWPIDPTLQKLYLGVTAEELVDRLGVMTFDAVKERFDAEGFTDLKPNVGEAPGLYRLGTRWARDYVSQSAEYTTYDGMQHKHYLLQQLYRMTAKEMAAHPDSPGVAEMCASYHAFFGKDGQGVSLESLQRIGMTQPVTKKYAIIHSRSFEGKDFLEESHRHYGVDPRASLDYPPDLIRTMLAPLGMADHSILMITDGQDPTVADRLSKDPDIGPHFQVVPQEVSTMMGDILLGVLSEVFIGNPASSFSQYIAMVRYALGMGPSYLHVWRGAKDEWEIFCDDESCFYKLHDLEAATHQPSAPKTI
ncbi:hypothetical protein ACHAXT_009065 [Thalassiosira profunda]